MTGDLAKNDEEEPPTWRDIACEIDLFGRIKYNKEVVSFWNEDSYPYEQLKPCLKELIDGGYLLPDCYISTPIHQTIPLSQLDNSVRTELTPEQREKMELYKKLHLMRGAEKKAAMKELGVGGGGKPHEMQTALRGAGLQKPGQKWWAPHSESFNRSLNNALSGL